MQEFSCSIEQISKSDVFRIFLGFDKRQPVAYQVLAHSIWARASKSVSITPLIINQLPIKRVGLTGFTYSRFLVPYLSDFKGYSLFLDSDELCVADILDIILYPVAYPGASVYMVNHQFEKYECPSVMLFDNSKCKNLTPEFIDNPTNNPFNLKWADKIGVLPKEWNHLVGYDQPNPEAKIIHYTQGVPIWPETKDCELSELWWNEFKLMNSSVSFDELMGKSVHAKHVYERLERAKTANS